MIRSYTVGELEKLSGCTRRSISDYIAKGVLGGPSHRGRGARYPQKDLDVLTVLPRIRTLMKKEYPTLKEVSAFLEELSLRDINRLATRGSEDAFVSEVRRLRVRNSLMGLLPYVPPERIEALLARLTPGQVRGIDSGRYQIGAVMDIDALLKEESRGHRAPGSDANSGNGYRQPSEQPNGGHINGANRGLTENTSWSVNWLNGQKEGVSQTTHEAVPSIVGSNSKSEEEQERKMVETTPDLGALLVREEESRSVTPEADHTHSVDCELNDRLSEIALRLEHLESLLDKA